MFLLVPAHLGSPGQRAVKRLLFCAVLYTTVVHNITHTHVCEQFLKLTVGLGLGLFLCVCLGLLFCVFFCFSLFLCCLILLCCI